jgi:hypothetical protein
MIDFTALFAKARAAATLASGAYLAANGEHPFNCGFAWVSVRPARGKFVSWCKAQSGREYGRRHEGDGWVFWSPGNYNGQDMDVKRAGAEAFAAVLAEAGIKAVVCSRLD